MWIEAHCRLELDYERHTPLILMLRPRSGASQWVASESYDLSVGVAVKEYTDVYGNLCQQLTAPPDGFVIETSARVDTTDQMDAGVGEPFMDIISLPESVLQFLNPSRYCESDRLGSQALAIAGLSNPGYDQVANIVAWIREHVSYQPGTSALPRSAVEIQAAGAGVCKDLAHLGIAMSRSISIPARMVVGYLCGLEPMDLHAWFEVFVGDRWYTFDATQPDIRGPRIAIAYGKDAADVSIYHQFGPPARFTDMRVTVSKI